MWGGGWRARGPLSSEYVTNKTLKARSWPWLSGNQVIIPPPEDGLQVIQTFKLFSLRSKGSPRTASLFASSRNP